MGMELFEAYGVFRQSVESADAYLRDELSCEWSVIQELGESTKQKSKIGIATYSQPLCTVLQVALVDLLRDWKIMPQSVVGHSSGEIAAAYCMGALSRESAWMLAYFRGTLSTTLKQVAPDIQGAMLALGLGPGEATAMIEKAQAGAQVSVACVNSPTSVTISGDADGIERMLVAAESEGAFARKLQVDTAYHSSHMELVSQDYMSSIYDLKVEPNAAKSGIRMHTSVTGAVVHDPDELGPAHWVKNLICPVQFSAAIQDLVRPLSTGSKKRSRENAVDILVEIGPHSALRGPSVQSIQAICVSSVPCFSAITRSENGVQTALGLAGTLFSHGVPLDFAAANGDKSSPRPPRTLVDLPPYQWNHSQKYWAETRLVREFRLREHGPRSLIGAPFPATSANEHIWRGFLRLEEQPWVNDHKINDLTLYPGAGFIVMAVEGIRQMAFDQDTQNTRTITGFRLRDIQLISAMLVSPDKGEIEYTLSLKAGADEGWYRFAVASSGDGRSLTDNCIGAVLVEYDDVQLGSAEQLEIAAAFATASSSCHKTVDPGKFYETLRHVGFHYGPCFSNVTSLSCRPCTCVGSIVIPDVGFTVADTSPILDNLYKERPHIVHPTFLDAVFHLGFAALMGDGQKMTNPMVPTYIDEIYLSSRLPIDVGKHLKGFAYAKMAGLRNLQAEIAVMYEQESSPVLTIRGLHCSQIDNATSGAAGTGLPPAVKKYASQMIWRPHLQLLSEQDLKSWIQSKAKTVDEVLAEYIQLSHHIRPGMALLEFTPTEKSQSLLSSLISFGIAPLLNAARYTVCVPSTTAVDGIKNSLEPVSAMLDMSIHVTTSHLFSEKPPDTSETAPLPLADLVLTVDLCARGLEHTRELLQKLSEHLSTEGELLVVQHDAGNVSSLNHLARQAGLVVDAEISAAGGVLIVLKTMDVIKEQDQSNGKRPTEKPVTLLTWPSATQAAKVFLQDLYKSLLSVGLSPSIVNWDPARVHSLQDKDIISLLELEKPFWRDLVAPPDGTGEASFLSARDLILSSESVTWITGFADPATEMVVGIARVVRNENPGLSFRTINIFDALNTRAAELVSKCFVLRGGTQPDDTEFRLDQGVVQVNRVSVDMDANDAMDKRMSAANAAALRPIEKVKLASLAKSSCLRLAVEVADGLDSLHFVQEKPLAKGNVTLPEDLAEDEIEIAVEASCLREADLATVKGQNRLDPTLLGLEASGIVTRIGSKESKFRPGDRVMVLTPGAHRTLLRTKSGLVGKMPDGLKFEAAACIPFAFTTAWHALVYLARPTSCIERTCLMIDALNAVGRQALHIARQLGFQVFVTVDSVLQADYAVNVLNVNRSHIIILPSIGVWNLPRAITRLIPGKQGLDIVIDCSGRLTGEALRQTMRTLAPFGHYFRCVVDGSPAFAAPITSIASSPNLNTTISTVDIAYLLRNQPETLAHIVQQAFQFFREFGGHISERTQSFPASNIVAAIRAVETGSVENTVVTYSAKDIIPAKLYLEPLDLSPGLLPGTSLDPNAIYILSGGLGGLGRSPSIFLVEKLGARKLVFLSRSGATSPSASQLLNHLRALKTRPTIAAYVCDVSNRRALADALSKAEAEMGGKVSGVIQCAMVLRDTLWSNTSYKQWVDSTLPKVQGTANLSMLLPDVDFFLSLSSFAGIFGNRGQANCAAGNCYQDALARHRRQALGLKSGLTIDVPSMRDIGVLAETGMLESLREWDEVEAKFSIMEKTDMVFLADSLEGRAASSDQRKDKKSIRDVLTKVADLDEATEVIMQALVERVAEMQRVSVEEIDTSRYLHSYGLDSLVAIEVAN
ncbi:hypothetical protein MCOR25_010043 [Pyricularia grisea]|nr:hypothetical protein MCOR25_010043 [Pyricularia grisea]